MPSEDLPVYLIGFKIIATGEVADFYTLVYGDDDSPLLRSGRIVFFKRPEQAIDASSLLPERARTAADLPTEVDYTYDFLLALSRLALAETDPSSQILNCLNVAFDFVKALDVDLPRSYKDVMRRLADHLTFAEDYGQFLKDEGIERDTVRDGLYWCLGLVLMRADILETPLHAEQ